MTCTRSVSATLRASSPLERRLDLHSHLCAARRDVAREADELDRIAEPLLRNEQQGFAGNAVVAVPDRGRDGGQTLGELAIFIGPPAGAKVAPAQQEAGLVHPGIGPVAAA
jgi:hypothetical protein